MPLKAKKSVKSLRVVRSAEAGIRQRRGQGGQLRDFLPLSSFAERDAIDRVRLVKEGVPAELLVVIANEMAITKEKLYATIGLPRATADRKVRLQKRLSTEESERAMGIATLVGQVDQIVRESGEPKGFEAAKWVAGWLDRPHAALGGQRPGSLMDTAEGRRIVSDLAAQMQSSAYA